MERTTSGISTPATATTRAPVLVSTWRYHVGPNYSGNKDTHWATRYEQNVIARRTSGFGWCDHRPQGGRSAWPNTWYRCS